MSKTIVGLYDDLSTAQTVVQELINAGVDRSDIGLMANNVHGEYSHHVSGDDNTGSGAATGAAGGAVVGGIGGLLLGLGALAIPGVGPIIAAGPIVSALTGAGIGAVAGGVIGALTDIGVPEDEAHYYAEGIRRGGTLVTVRTSDDLIDRASSIMNSHGAINVEERVQTWRQSGWQKFDHTAQPLTKEEVLAHRKQRLSFGTGPSAQHTTATSKAIPVVEEELRVGKREVEQGGVRVHSTIQEKPVEAKVNLREEKVTVERHPVDKTVSPTEADRAFREETIEMREKSEEAIVDKKARVVEEVVVKKDVEEHTETIRDTVRKTDVHVDKVIGNEGRYGTGWDRYRDTFARNHQTQYASSGLAFEKYEPAYRYGYDVASDARYSSKDWSAIEPDVRRDWESRNQGPWEQFKDVVRDSYQTVKGGAKEAYNDTKNAIKRNT